MPPPSVSSRLQDEPPLALLLRSGDAVVMSGESRRCYHGVPRVLTDRPLPPELEAVAAEAEARAAEAAAEGTGGFAPFLEHMRGCRINISIRAAG